jgi:hypothetical protein
MHLQSARTPMLAIAEKVCANLPTRCLVCSRCCQSLRWRWTSPITIGILRKPSIWASESERSRDLLSTGAMFPVLAPAFGHRSITTRARIKLVPKHGVAFVLDLKRHPCFGMTKGASYLLRASSPRQLTKAIGILLWMESVVSNGWRFGLLTTGSNPTWILPIDHHDLDTYSASSMAHDLIALCPQHRCRELLLACWYSEPENAPDHAYKPASWLHLVRCHKTAASFVPYAFGLDLRGDRFTKIRTGPITDKMSVPSPVSRTTAWRRTRANLAKPELPPELST